MSASPYKLNSFLNVLSRAPDRLVILSAFEQYCDKFEPPTSAPSPPPSPYSTHSCLSTLYRQFYRHLTYPELLTMSESVIAELKVTSSEIQLIEMNTRMQHKCQLWHEQRVGRLTASVFHTACHIRIERPPDSFVKKICTSSFQRDVKAPSLMWGREHEADAKKMYCEIMRTSHSHHRVEECGLVIHEQLPFLAASPDGIIVDDCCGKGVLECKCPYTCRDLTIKDVPYLYRDNDNQLCVDESHPYYYQIQGQMHVCGFLYADLVVWIVDECAVVRIQYDAHFCDVMCNKLFEVFKCIIMPCLLTDDVNVHKCQPTDGTESLAVMRRTRASRARKL